MNLHESEHNNSQRAKLQHISIDIVIALLNTVCFVNISIPKAKGRRICEEYINFIVNQTTLRDL
jgi:hypothetical protein